MRLIFYFVMVSLLLACQQKEALVAPNYDSLRVVLEKMVFEDQNIRRILVDSLGLNSPAAGPFIRKMTEIDVYNQEQLGKILERYGWIGRSKIGEEAADAFFYIVQHSNVEMMERWFPALDSLSKIGEASTVHAAMMHDRLLTWKGKKQIFGSQTHGSRVWPIEDPEHINERRAKAGFNTTIEEYASRMGVVFDPNDTIQ